MRRKEGRKLDETQNMPPTIWPQGENMFPPLPSQASPYLVPQHPVPPQSFLATANVGMDRNMPVNMNSIPPNFPNIDSCNSYYHNPQATTFIPQANEFIPIQQYNMLPPPNNGQVFRTEQR